MKIYKRNQYGVDVPLNLRAGEWIEVRCQEEILATLDKKGCFENLPFMPEMVQFCGKKYQVYKRADKTCDTISGQRLSRRMKNSIHLAKLRCDGEAHGKCDTTCLLFWKEAWLKRIDESNQPIDKRLNTQPNHDKCTIEDVINATRVDNASTIIGDEVYSCQATELLKFTSSLPWWDIRQYWREFASGNLGIKEIMRLLSIGMLNYIINIRGVGRIYFLIAGVRRYPYMDTRLLVNTKTPFEVLNLQPGEIVEVKNIEEILPTLNTEWMNRGLSYDSAGEMLEYCGKKMKVIKRVQKVIDEKSGKLLFLKNDTIILDGAICCGHYSPNRLFCPRSLYAFWREIWLKRIEPENNEEGNSLISVEHKNN